MIYLAEALKKEAEKQRWKKAFDTKKLAVNYMTVASLRKQLSFAPDDAVIVLNGQDHSFNALGKRECGLAKSNFCPRSNHFAIDYGPEYERDPNTILIEVFTIGEIC